MLLSQPYLINHETPVAGGLKVIRKELSWQMKSKMNIDLEFAVCLTTNAFKAGLIKLCSETLKDYG